MQLIAASAHAQTWAFDVFLDKTNIGKHTFTLDEHSTLTSTANFKVKILFINAYQYQHQALEEWNGDCLKKLTANTLEKQVKTLVNGQLNVDHFSVDNGKTQQSLPACIMTFAYWNPAMLQQKKLLNPQNGEWLDTEITQLNDEDLVVLGKKVTAKHYQLLASLAGVKKLNIELWYDNHMQWLALKSITPEGYVISYQLK